MQLGKKLAEGDCSKRAETAVETKCPWGTAREIGGAVREDRLDSADTAKV